MPSPSDPRNLRAKWQRALEERRKAGAVAPPIDVTPRAKGRGAEAGPSAGTTEPERRAAEREATPAPREPEAARTSSDAPGKSSDGVGEASGGVGEASDASGKASNAPQREPAALEPGSSGADEDRERREKKPAAATSVASSIFAALVLVGGVGFALRTFIAPEDPPEDLDEGPAAPAPASASAMDPAALLAIPPPGSARAPLKTRCSAPAREPFVIGDASAPRAATPDAGDDDGHDDELQPFAVEVGRGARWGDGFAIGAQRPGEGGTISMVATLDADGGGKLVRLARSRGDFDPPVITTAGAAILAAMMEPNAGGRAIRVAKVEGDRVTWGPELAEGNDESAAVDLAATGSRAIVVWDDVPLGRERSVIELATFDVTTMAGSGARPVTPPSVDADGPRLARRPGGYWLAYLAHGEPPTEPTASKDEEPDADPKGPRKKSAEPNPDDSDTEAAGEALAQQWIELVPLDAEGFPAGAARAVTPRAARVIGFDLHGADDGRAVVVYREDDTPSGSTGGRVEVVVAELGGVGEPHVVAEEGVGTGVPQLHGEWVSIHSLSGPVRLGVLGPKGDLAGELVPETSLKLGEILGGHDGLFLLGTPAGRAMKLAVVRCAR